MIGRILTELRTSSRSPVGPGTALLGGLCVVIGASIVQRYIHQQQAALAVAWRDYHRLVAESKLLAHAAGGGFAEDRYPGPDDVDPLHNGHRDDQADELADALKAEAEADR